MAGNRIRAGLVPIDSGFYRILCGTDRGIDAVKTSKPRTGIISRGHKKRRHCAALIGLCRDQTTDQISRHSPQPLFSYSAQLPRSLMTRYSPLFGLSGN